MRGSVHGRTFCAARAGKDERPDHASDAEWHRLPTWTTAVDEGPTVHGCLSTRNEATRTCAHPTCP